MVTYAIDGSIIEITAQGAYAGQGRGNETEPNTETSNHKDVATRIAEMTIGFAVTRLAMANKAIDSYGPDAEMRTI